jgi:hypothetical protein
VLVLLQFDVCEAIRLERLQEVIRARTVEQPSLKHPAPGYVRYQRPPVVEPGFSLLYFRRPYPDWLYDWLVISYGLLFIGQIRAWWIPYLSDRNRSELLAIKSCSAKRIPSCRRAMEWSQTPRISCFIWRPPPR